MKKQAIYMLTLLFLACSLFADWGGRWNGQSLNPWSDSVQYYAQEYGAYFPDGANTWGAVRVETNTSTSGTELLSVTNGPGVVSFCSFLFKEAQTGGSPTIDTQDSSVSLQQLCIVIDGDTAVNMVPIQDCFGTAELCSTATSYLFGKSVYYRNTVDVQNTSQWFCKIPMAYQDSISIKVVAPAARYTPYVWFTGLGWTTTALDTTYYRLKAVYAADDLGKRDVRSVFEYTTDTTGTGLPGTIRVIAIGNYTDGVSQAPMPYTTTRWATSSGHLKEGAWVLFSNGCKPVITTTATATEVGATEIVLNKDMDGYEFPADNAEAVFVVKARRNPERYLNGTFWLYPTVSDSTVTKYGSSQVDTIRESLPAGSVVFAGAYKSPWAITDCIVFPGREEFMGYSGYYLGDIAQWFYGQPKCGDAACAAQYRKQYGMFPNVATVPLSWYRIYDPPLAASTIGEAVKGLYLYQTNNDYNLSGYWYNRERTIVWAYLSGAAGEDPQFPVYTYVSQAETLAYSSLQDGYTKVAALDWPSAAHCSTSGSALIWDPVDFKDDTTMSVGGIDEGDSLANYAAYLTYPISDEAVDFDPCLVDSVNLVVTCTQVGTGSNDSVVVLVPKLAHDGDSLQIDDSTDCAAWRGFRRWGNTTTDTTLAAVQALAEGANTIRMNADAVPYLFQRVSGKWYLHVMLVSWYDYKQLDPAESLDLTLLKTADAAVGKPVAYVYRSVSPDTGSCLWSYNDSCAVLSRSVCLAKGGDSWWKYGGGCPTPVEGRCCYNENADCADTTKTACDALGGVWDADSACTDPCVAAAPTGRCCYADGASCATNTLAECNGLSGVWDEGITCISDPCTTRVAVDTTILAVYDTYIRSSAPDNSYGSCDSFHVGYTNAVRPGFLYFGLICPTDSELVVTAAVCSLRTNLAVVGTPDLSLYKTACDWFEGSNCNTVVYGAVSRYSYRGWSKSSAASVTGNTLISDSAWCDPKYQSAAYDTVEVSAAGTWYVWDNIVGLVQALADTAATNFGMVLGTNYTTSNQYGGFVSSEGAEANRPRLHVEGYYVVRHY